MTQNVHIRQAKVTLYWLASASGPLPRSWLRQRRSEPLVSMRVRTAHCLSYSSGPAIVDKARQCRLIAAAQRKAAL